MSHLINIFVEPGKVFAELKEKPTFLLPMALMMVLTVVMSLMYFNKVDSEWMAGHQLAMSGSEMSAAEIEQAKKMMPSASVLGIISAIFAPFMIVVVTLIMALYYLIAGKVTGAGVSYKHSVSLVAWSGVPATLSLVALIFRAHVERPAFKEETILLAWSEPSPSS